MSCFPPPTYPEAISDLFDQPGPLPLTQLQLSRALRRAWAQIARRRCHHPSVQRLVERYDGSILSAPGDLLRELLRSSRKELSSLAEE